jgi:hypothetical protein
VSLSIATAHAFQQALEKKTVVLSQKKINRWLNEIVANFSSQHHQFSSERVNEMEDEKNEATSSISNIEKIFRAQ